LRLRHSPLPRIRPASTVLSAHSLHDALPIFRVANDTNYGLGAGVWTRNGNIAYRAGRDIQAGRVWVNQYHNYPAHAHATRLDVTDRKSTRLNSSHVSISSAVFCLEKKIVCRL